jgi:hypothetical protein
MRAPVIRASFSSAWSFGILTQASSKRRCSSGERIRVRLFCNLNRFTALAGESTDKPFDRFGEDRLERVELAIHRSRLDGIGR